MPDLGTDDAPWLEALIAAQGGQNPRGTTPIGPPQGIPGQFPGILDRINTWANRNMLGGQSPQQLPSGMAGVVGGPNPAPQTPMDLIRAGAGAIPPALNRMNAWANQNAIGGTGAPIESQGPQAPPPMPQGNLQPAALTGQAPTPQPGMGQGGQIPFLPQMASAMPQRMPPQGVPPQQAPQQPPAIPPASPQARVAAAQGQQQGSPLDNYFKQLMALQQQRMMLGMAGGLLGAPSLGMGLGRAFTNASESLAPQGDMVTKIAAAQAAGQLERQRPHSSPEDVQAVQMQTLFGKPFEPPRFEKYEHGTFERKAGGRDADTTTGYSTWVHGHMGLDHDGKPVPVGQAATADLGNGHTAVLLDDHKWHDAYHPTEEGSER